MIRALIVACLILSMSTQAQSQPVAAAPPAVTVVIATPGEIVETVSVTGSLVARNEVLVSAQLEGQAILEILVDEGDRVARGQVLARLARDTLEANLAQFDAQIARADASAVQARAQIAQMRATMAQTAASLDRGRQLLASGTTSRETFEQRQAGSQVAVAQEAAAEGALASAVADRALAQAQRQEVAARLGRADIRAPVAGLVSRRSARLGAVASMAGEPLFRIIADGTLELEGNVPEGILARLRPQMAAQVAVTGHDAARPGQVRLVSPEVSTATRLGRVRIALDDSAGLALGAFGRARVEVARATGVLVPLSAVLAGATDAVVQVVADGVVATRHVRLGLRDGRSAQILSGVAAGERVVSVSGTFVRDGDRVTPVLAR